LDSAGIDPEGRELVREFFAAENKTEVIEKAKGKKGYEYYSAVMERYVKGGAFGVQKEAVNMLTHLEATKGRVAASVSDTLKKSYNVLLLFAPRQTPGPTPEGSPDL
jgi:hypothetical protein